jgi:hypothetical protein
LVVQPQHKKVFILSPAHCGGERAKLIYRKDARFDLAVRLRHPSGVALAEAFSFLSGLYFRGKVAYAKAFGDNSECASPSSYVITTNRGLLPIETCVTTIELKGMGRGDIDQDLVSYRRPLAKSAHQLACSLAQDGQAILLGSIATGKYVDVLLEAFGERLMFPEEFIGRGDMSRGGLMLRCVDEGRELTYLPIAGAVRRGRRPPRLAPRLVKRLQSRRG